MRFKLIESNQNLYDTILNDIEHKFDLTGTIDDGKCNEVSSYIEKKYNLPKKKVSVFGINPFWTSIDGHYVNIDDDTIVDFTLQQYAKDLNKNIENIPNPNIAIYDEENDYYESNDVVYYLSK